jgi:hypothetical protein
MPDLSVPRGGAQAAFLEADDEYVALISGSSCWPRRTQAPQDSWSLTPTGRWWTT